METFRYEQSTVDGKSPDAVRLGEMNAQSATGELDRQG